jgi:hypothetical protein
MRPVYWIAAAAAIAVAVTLLLSSPTHDRRPGSSPARSPQALPGLARIPQCGAECDPIDARFLADLTLGRVSFWIQPWRAYLDTWPAGRLPSALGINFNVKPAMAAAVARLLHGAGFRHARVAVGWDTISYADPGTFTHEPQIRAKFAALHSNGLRPLIVLGSSSGVPCPARKVNLETVSPAAAGATTVVLSGASAARVVPGQSGFNPGAFGARPGARRARRHRAAAPLTPEQRLARRAARRAAGKTAPAAPPPALHTTPSLLIAKVGRGGIATLSRPLPAALPAGPHSGTTLLYAPFGPRTLPSGAPNPAFRETLLGWLRYVATVAAEARRVFGAGGYDLEVWNELTSASAFLAAANYSSPPGDPAAVKAVLSERRSVTKSTVKAILNSTVAYVRNPANGISPRVGVSDGFASQTPFAGGAFAPRGLTAISKHPYMTAVSYPLQYSEGRIRPINALGASDTASRSSYDPLFIPRFQALLPEYTLTGLSATTLVHDIAPIPTTIARAPHGRDVGPPGAPPVAKWITEYNLGTGNSTVMRADGATPQTGRAATLSASDREHFHAKALLRSLVAMVSKGVSREYFSTAAHGPLSLIGERFYAALEADPQGNPGERLAGEVVTGLRHMLSRFEGPGPGGAPRQLKLLSIVQDGNHAQFTGDGTAAHPSLYDREVLAVFPFQASPTRYEIPVYVMTSNLLTLYAPLAASTDVRRFDLPGETFRITLGNLPASPRPPIVSAYDPLRDRRTQARVVSRRADTAVFELAATDYPRVLHIEYRE